MAASDPIDLFHAGAARTVGAYLLDTSEGLSLFDCGPSSCLAALKSGLAERGHELGDVEHLLLSHIHLDHAGATGSIVEKHPHIEVLVHARGARHMIDPSKLLASASRLYGQDMDRLWGDVKPVDAARIRVLEGGETIAVAGREMRVEYTPGHASHHVSYFDTASRVAFVGDTAGIRRGSGAFVMPPTPPPDIDIEAWRESEKKILAWDPDTLFLTHFGPHRGARQHLQGMFENLAEWSRIVRRLLANTSLSDDERQSRFTDEVSRDLVRRVGETEASDYTKAGGLNYSYQGLARYWQKRTS